MAAFLLTPNGFLFWNECNSENKEYFKKNGFKGISEFCIKSGLIINGDMENIFDNHLLNGFKSKLDPINYWLSQNNDLTEISCRSFILFSSK